jgi:hypothetical protein
MNKKNSAKCIKNIFNFGLTFLVIVTAYQYNEGPKRNPDENRMAYKGIGLMPKSSANFLNKYARINIAFESKKMLSI